MSKDWKQMNQRERAVNTVEAMRSISVHRTPFVLDKLNSLAKSDGSCTPEEQAEFRELAYAAKRYAEALSAARKSLKLLDLSDL